MIPKIIHQTWKNRDVPKEYIKFQKKVTELHPDWEYRLWTDEDNLAFVEKHFPDFYGIFTKFPKNIMRADTIRYLIMFHFGGVYLDLDYEMLKPFDLLNHGLVLPYSRNKTAGDDFDAFGNCIFGSTPGHPFWKYVIDDLKEERDYEEFSGSLHATKPYITESTSLVEAVTGPGLITRIFYACHDKLQDYVLPGRELFHPVSPRTDDEYARMVAKGVSYGIHHCSGSWRDKSFLRRIRLRVEAVFNTAG